MSGYITEKILDCLESGIVPIYAGAPNIDRIIPNDCFIDYIDDKSCNIITTDNEEISLWKKHNKIYAKMKIFKGKYDKLFNISDNIFGAIKSYDQAIYFFNHNDFQIMKTININDDFEIIGVINNEILCIQKQSNLLFIDLKYFEIIFIKEIEEGFNHIKIVDNYLLQFYGKENKLKIKKDFFNLKHRQFEKEEL